MYRVRTGPRFEYRELIGRQVSDSPSLSARFPQLKSLTVDLGYYNSAGVPKNSQIKYTPNLDFARSVFRVDCPNNGCIRGDFDLSESLANAVAAHRATVSGELCCQGWQSKTTIDTVPCHNILRFTIGLVYETGRAPAALRA